MLIELKKLVHCPSRSGRELQRYDMGRRQVVGCIPYRITHTKCFSSVDDILEVLMVSSQKGEAMMFPKGGWEKDESSMEEAALRESLEEAGVIGSIQLSLGNWIYKSKTKDILHDGYMFPLLVEEELEYWPERDVRQRKWVSVKEAKDLCAHLWMTEALELLVQRLDRELASFEVSCSPCYPDVLALYGLEASENRDDGEVPRNMSIINQSNFVDCHNSRSYKSNQRDVKSELSSFTKWSMKANVPPHDGAQANLLLHEISVEHETAVAENGSLRRYAVLDSPEHRAKPSHTLHQLCRPACAATVSLAVRNGSQTLSA